jgi:hypothetical protein
MRPDHEGVEFPRSRHDLGLSAVPCGFSPSAVRRNLAIAVSSSRELYASSTVLTTLDLLPVRPRNLAAPQAPKSASLAVLSLIAASTSSVHNYPGFSSQAVFRPRRFSRPRRLAPPLALQACFIPQPRPGFALQGFVPLHGAVPGFPGRFMPSCR